MVLNDTSPCDSKGTAVATLGWNDNGVAFASQPAAQRIEYVKGHVAKFFPEIATEYDLSLGEIYAALSYYHDHREEINRSIEEGNAFVEELKRKTPSKLAARLRG